MEAQSRGNGGHILLVKVGRCDTMCGEIEKPRNEKQPRAEVGPMDFVSPAAASARPRILSSTDLPLGLGEMALPPQDAFLWGELPPPPWVSIVGTRSPSRAGLTAAFRLARGLARSGVTVVSGGAVGIDTAAHLGALAGRGPTLVVAPTWYDVAYPKVNQKLFARILQKGGGYLTVSHAGARPLPYVFFRRNEALVALSHAVILGECPFKSGAKNAMLHARALRRPRFALPFLFEERGARGSWEEIVVHGAEILIDAEPVLDLLEEYGPFENDKWWEFVLSRGPSRGQLPLTFGALPVARSRRGKRRRRAESGLPDLALGSPKVAPQDLVVESAVTKEDHGAGAGSRERVIEAVRAGHRTTEQICQSVGLSPESVQHEILLLLIDGWLSEDDGGLLRYHSPAP